MKLILLRHGDRGSGFGDVPLSTEGRQQAQRLSEDSEIPHVDHLFCSPKLRTRQTVEPFCQRRALEINIEPDLDQKKSIESSAEFSQRVLQYIEHLPKQFSQKTVLLCSHSDWLQEAILQMPTDSRDMAVHCFFGCSEYKILKHEDGLWRIL